MSNPGAESQCAAHFQQTFFDILFTAFFMPGRKRPGFILKHKTYETDKIYDGNRLSSCRQSPDKRDPPRSVLPLCARNDRSAPVHGAVGAATARAGLRWLPSLLDGRR
jgi:hypothetical protein